MRRRPQNNGARDAMSILVSLLLALPAADVEPDLDARLAPLAKAHKGKVAVGVKHLGTGESWYRNPDVVMPTASLIKISVLVEAYLQADDGKFNLRDTVELKEADKVPGSGILTTHFSEGARLPVRDLLRLMCAVSDNTAT